MQLKTLQEDYIKGTLKEICYPEELPNGIELANLITAMQKAFTLGIMKGVEMVEEVVPEIKARHELPIENSPELYGDKRSVAWAIGHSACRSEILSNITKLKQELK